MDRLDISPWPVITATGELSPGILLEINPTCSTCEHRSCRSFHDVASPLVTEHICSKGYSCFSHKGQASTVYVGLANPERADLRRIIERQYKYHFTLRQISDWIKRTENAISAFTTSTNDYTTRALVRSLHNIQPAVNTVVRSSEAIINTLQGRDFSEKLSSADKSLKDMYYCAKLVIWMIDIQHNLINPDSITYGKRSPRQIYQTVDRLVRSFRLLASPNRIRINLTGTSYMPINAYESIANLFVILLDNAVKYSLEDQQISVEVQDSGDRVTVSVTSFGPMIDRDELLKIFNPGYRGKFGRMFTDEGTGRGLYIASLIAEKHNTKVICETDFASVKFIDKLPFTVTKFSVALH